MKSQLIENEDLYTCVWWTGKHEVRHEAWFYYNYNTKQWFYGKETVQSDKPLTISLEDI